jgi:hypothetical protein
MAGPNDRTDEAALWRRWRSASVLVGPTGGAPDAVLLAAYAEGRLSEEAAAPVEDWLAVHPDAISDFVAAQRSGRDEHPVAPTAVVARAEALVAVGDAHILTFPPAAPRRAGWRTAALWSGMAASLAVTSLIGFSLGNSAYLSLVDGGSPAFGQELFDPPTGLFNSLDEDPNT